MKKMFSISIILFSIIVLIMIGITLFCSENQLKSLYWISLNGDSSSKQSESFISLIVGEGEEAEESYKAPSHLKRFENYSDKIVLKKEMFSKCKDLEEVIFYKNPSKIEQDTFSECTGLKTIYFLDKSKPNFTEPINIPENCSIRFKNTIEKNINDPECEKDKSACCKCRACCNR